MEGFMNKSTCKKEIVVFEREELSYEQNTWICHSLPKLAVYSPGWKQTFCTVTKAEAALAFLGGKGTFVSMPTANISTLLYSSLQSDKTKCELPFGLVVGYIVGLGGGKDEHFDFTVHCFH